MRSFFFMMSAAFLFAGCSNESDKADAYGTFEVTEVIVSAETGGNKGKHWTVSKLVF